MKTEIMTYFRDKHNRKRGMFIAKLTDSSKMSVVHIGWSLCKRGEEFDRETGLKTAETNMGVAYPRSMKKQMRDFRAQAFLTFCHDGHQPFIQEPFMKSPKEIKKVRPPKPVRNSGHVKGCPALNVPQDRSYTRGQVCLCFNTKRAAAINNPEVVEAGVEPASIENIPESVKEIAGQIVMEP